MSLWADLSCEELKKDKNLLNKEEAVNLAASCEFSLKNQNFTKRLYELSNEIRGENSSCNGILYLSKLKEFDFLLLKISLDPNSYQKGLDTPLNLEKKFDAFKSYFRYWGYQSIGNFRLYRAFWQEYNKAIEPLQNYFETNFKLDKGSAIYYTSNALNEFLNWAVGETKIFRDISLLSKIVANKNYTLSDIKTYVFSNNISPKELTIALQAALLNQRNEEILDFLIGLKADIELGYESAIFYALENYENVNFLIKKGANVNQTNAFGKTPLFYAVEFNQSAVVSLLLENGANVNQKYINNNQKLALTANIGSNTPYYITLCALEHTSKNVLMHAASFSDTEILKLLVSKGANINAVDDLGFNALDFALAAGKKENAQYLKSLGLKENENLSFGKSLE